MSLEKYSVQPTQTTPHAQCSWTAQQSPEGYTYYYNWTTGGTCAVVLLTLITGLLTKL